MRSRYSAYVMQEIDYLTETTHPDKRSKNLKDEIMQSLKNTTYTSLTIHSTFQGTSVDKIGKVLFEATFSTGDQKHTHKEHSRFKRFKTKWCYYDGVTE